MPIDMNGITYSTCTWVLEGMPRGMPHQCLRDTAYINYKIPYKKNLRNFMSQVTAMGMILPKPIATSKTTADFLGVSAVES